MKLNWQHGVLGGLILAAQSCNCGIQDAGEDGGMPDAGVDEIVSAEVLSDFSAGDEGWTTAGDAQRPIYHESGGNPGGTISAKDNNTGDRWYFVAPQKFLGDNRQLIGKQLKFDLKVSPVSPKKAFGVKLVGSGSVVLTYDTPFPLANVWTSYVVPLSATGWRVGTLEGAAATDAQFEAVMRGLTALWIRGEFNSVGVDTGFLDNVHLGASK